MGINENAIGILVQGIPFLNWYAPFIGPPVNKSVVITFPLAYDQIDTISSTKGQTFDAYQITSLRPSMILIDQIGEIRLRYDGASTAPQFDPHLEEIKNTIAELLENPPTGN